MKLLAQRIIYLMQLIGDKVKTVEILDKQIDTLQKDPKLHSQNVLQT